MKDLLILCILLSFINVAVGQSDPAIFLKNKKKKIEVILQAGNFHQGEYIADIGAGIGWLDAAIGIYHDSLIFYLEDIDSSHLLKNRLPEALTEYAREKAGPITCSYTQVIGTEKSTLLPDSTFDKVLLIDTFHHLNFRDEMIRDLFRILKPGGKLIVHEPLAGHPGVMYKPCEKMIYTSDEVITFIRERGFELEATYDNGKSVGKKVRAFVFGRW